MSECCSILLRLPSRQRYDNKVKSTTLGYEAGLKLARQCASPSIPRMYMRTTTPYGHLLQVLRPSLNLQSAKACRCFSVSSAWATSMTWAPAVKPALHPHGTLGSKSLRLCSDLRALLPFIMLSADVAEKQHILDLTQAKDAPRFDSVKSTAGDLGTHPASTNKDASGRRMCDVMYPRLRARAQEWAEQCGVVNAAASHPMFVATLTKTRDSPMRPQQLMRAGCDVNRIKALGFDASHEQALGKTLAKCELLHGGF